MATGDMKLQGHVIVPHGRDRLFDHFAHLAMHAGQEAVKQRGEFHLALSGGFTPEPFYEQLIIDPRWRGLPWLSTHVWIVDERRVPPEDDRSNFRMIRETLIDHVPTPPEQVHPMPVMEDAPDDLYEAALREHLPSGRLDFVVLGMGDDCHTASLFPGSPAVDVSDRLVAVNAGPKVTPPDRVTLTFPMLNAARQIVVLVTGATKTASLWRVDQQLAAHGPDKWQLPITGVKPEDGEMTWLLDAAAAGVES